MVNGHRFTVYHKPMSKHEFIWDLAQHAEVELVGEEVTSSSPPLPCEIQ